MHRKQLLHRKKISRLLNLTTRNIDYSECILDPEDSTNEIEVFSNRKLINTPFHTVAGLLQHCFLNQNFDVKTVRQANFAARWTIQSFELIDTNSSPENNFETCRNTPKKF